MMRKLLAALLAMALLAGCLSALADPSSPPDIFIPNFLCRAFNLSYVLVDNFYENLYGAELDSALQEEKATLSSRLALSYTETVGDVAYCCNEDRSIEIAACYSGRDVNLGAPADTLTLTISGSTWASEPEKMDLIMLLVARFMFDALIQQSFQVADSDALETWITSEEESGASFALDGYEIVLTREGNRYQYTLQPVNRADEPAPSPVEDDDYLFSWNGFTVELLRIEPVTYSSGDVYLEFYCRFINNSDYPLFLCVEDAAVNGVTVDGVGKTDLYRGIDTGPDSEECIWVHPASDNVQAGTRAICDPQAITMTLKLIETENYKTLYTRQITLPLSDVPRFTPKPTTEPTPTPVPASYYYDTLTRGDRGDGVAQMQMELIDLGYLAGEADGVFGAQTAEAVRLFSEANGLPSSEIATPEMQQKLFSYGAKAYEEPYVPLVIKSGAYGQWQKRSGNKIRARVKVTNVSRTKTIKAFEMYMYAEDIYGCAIYGDNTVYYGTTKKTVKPGETTYCDYIVMPNCRDVCTLYAGVKKVVFTDGTVRENSSVSYADWNVTW